MPFCFRWRISNFGAASKASSCVCASLSLPCPVRRLAVAMGHACRSIRLFVARPLVVPWFEFWRPGVLCWSPVRLTLRQLKSSRSSSTRSRWLLSGLSSSHCWSLLHWRHLSVFRPASAGDRYLSSLRAGDCGIPLRRRVHVRVLMVACLPLLRVWRTAPSHIPLMLCASTGIYFRSILASSRLSFVWVFGGLVQVFSCPALSVPVGVCSGFAPADFSSLWFCLVE